MNELELASQLRHALDSAGRSVWELSRRANVKVPLVEAMLRGSGMVPVQALCRLAQTLELQLLMTAAAQSPRIVGPVKSVVDLALEKLQPDRTQSRSEPPPDGNTADFEPGQIGITDQVTTPEWVLALDVEGTLVSNVVSAFVRPGLHKFLICCRPLFARIVVFTTVHEQRFRELARALATERSAPDWFANIEHVAWSGPVKDLAFVPGADPSRVLLVDDFEQCVHPEQRGQWIPIAGYEPPFDPDDAELERVLEELVRRTTAGADHARACGL